MHLLQDLAALAFPELCPGCGRQLLPNEHGICLHCLSKIPRNRFDLSCDNKAEMLLWGRFPINRGTAYCRFSQDSVTQKLLHSIKYKGNKKLAIEMGRLAGQEIADTVLATADCLLPVPLHKKKERVRGYNQSELLARGMGSITGQPVVTDVLYRQTENQSQTKQDKIGRWHNTKDIFGANLENGEKLYGKHVIIVDDVITTGSTLEACCRALSAIPDIKISFACFAMA